MAASGSSKKSPSSKATPPRPIPHQAQLQQEVVDPGWLLKALGVTAVAGVVCAWLALCLLYYIGSWQLVLRPAKAIEQTPATLKIAFEEIRFDAAETGEPRLTGWWLPVSPASRTVPLQNTAPYAAYTVLYLHDGTGSLSAAVPTLSLLHATGINVFAVDYRGFGHSDASAHPTSETMKADASAALAYLTETRHLSPNRIVLYGTGLGGSLAVGLAKAQGEIPAVIVDNPDPDPTRTAVGAHPSRLVPIRLLYHEHFEIAGPLASLATPKLLIAGGPNTRWSAAQEAQVQALFHSAHSPALTVVVPAADYDAAYAAALSRFLDQYLPRSDKSR